MAETSYTIDTWADLPHYTCTVPVGDAPCGWNCLTVEAITAHLFEAHGVTDPVAEVIPQTLSGEPPGEDV